MMIKLIVSLEIRRGQHAQFLAAMDTNARASRAEPGCLGFEVIEDLDDPDRFVLYETYVDDAAIEAHRETSHFAQWQSIAATCIEKRMVLRGRVVSPVSSGGGAAGGSCLCVHRADVEPFERGDGVVTYPGIGSWNCDTNGITTGRTVFEPGTGLPLHTHNVEESVLIVRGEARAVLDGETVELTAGDATWVPKDVPHRFANRGTTPLEISWVYGGRHVTRTICETGETFAHLSDHDRGAVKEA